LALTLFLLMEMRPLFVKGIPSELATRRLLETEGPTEDSMLSTSCCSGSSTLLRDLNNKSE
jgi:hypothetical protein